MFGAERARITARRELQHSLHTVLQCQESHQDGDDPKDDPVARYGTTLVSFTTGSTMCDAACGVRYTLIVAAL